MQFKQARSGLWVPSAHTDETDAVIFVDESGWTGANIADADQPVVFFGGLLIPTQHRQAFEVAIRKTVDDYPKDAPAEAKGHRLVKDHRPLALSIIKCCESFDAVFLVCGIHKLYQAACMIPHFVHDGAANPHIRDTAIDVRLEIALADKKPKHWVDPKELAVAYFDRLKHKPELLVAWYKSVWPDRQTGKGDPKAVEAALANIVAELDAGTEPGLTIKSLLTHPGVKPEQVEAACAVVGDRLGREPLVRDLFAVYNKSADLLRAKQDYEPGMVALATLMKAGGEWLGEWSDLYNRVRPGDDADFSEVFSANVVQDKPAVSGEVDYEAAYKAHVELAKRTLRLPWIKDHQFAESKQSAGVRAADVWTAIARVMWREVQEGRGHKWDNFARHVVKWSQFSYSHVAPPVELDRWAEYVLPHFQHSLKSQ